MTLGLHVMTVAGNLVEPACCYVRGDVVQRQKTKFNVRKAKINVPKAKFNVRKTKINVRKAKSNVRKRLAIVASNVVERSENDIYVGSNVEIVGSNASVRRVERKNGGDGRARRWVGRCASPTSVPAS